MIETAEIEAAEELEQAPDQSALQRKMDKAFITGNAVREVVGLKMQPYSPSREAAAQAMGLHYLYVDEAGVERFNRTKLYPGAIRDVVIVAWLCGVAKEDQIDAAGMEPRPYARMALDWARGYNHEGNGDLMDTAKDNFWLAYKFFFDLMNELEASRTVPKQKKITLGDTK